jgi:uncharacterized membrane protein
MKAEGLVVQSMVAGIEEELMGKTSVSRTINAPVSEVFDVVAHVENFSKAVPEIKEIEFLTDVHSGVGTKFRETRDMRGKWSTAELEVTEYEKDDRIRLVSDEAGAIWDSLYTVTAEGEGTRLTLEMESRPYKLLAKLTVPLVGGVVRKAVEADMDAVKDYCEQQQ